MKTKDGYFYVKEKQINDKIYWRCTAYTTKLRCHARIHTLKLVVVRRTEHNHCPNQIRNEKILLTHNADNTNDNSSRKMIEINFN